MSEVRITVKDGFGREVNPYEPNYNGNIITEWDEFEGNVKTLKVTNYTEDGEYLADIIYKINGCTIRHISQLIEDTETPIEEWYRINSPYVAPDGTYNDGYADKLAEVVELVEGRIKRGGYLHTITELENLLKELKK